MMTDRSNSPWATRFSAWAGLDVGDDKVNASPANMENAASGYRLVTWPDMPGTVRTAGVLRALSVMSHRAVTVTWFARQADWEVDSARDFLETLVQEGMAQKVGRGNTT